MCSTCATIASRSSPESTTLRPAPRRSIASRARSPPKACSPPGATSATPWRPQFGAPPWFELERAAARYFGIHTYAAHVNGLVRRDGEIAMWIARRSATKSIDPGMLDNLVAGGIAAGQSVASTVVKEAWEEAGIAAALAARAQPAGTVHICREQPDGLQRETIFVHDLWLPADFVPAGQDGEVVGHRLVSLREWARSSRTTRAPTSSPPMPRSSCSIACCATARSRPTRRNTARWKRCGIRRILCAIGGA